MNRLRWITTGLVASILLAASSVAAEKGVLPVSRDGKPLNLDFEDGTLKDWRATGQAFDGQPIKGDTVVSRRTDMRSNHQGSFWIGTFERSGDKPQGTLTSAPFRVTRPWASFLLGGGDQKETRVELIQIGEDRPFFTASGTETEEMRRVAADLTSRQGKEIYIRLVDNDSGGWGHINFDDFRFFAQTPPTENPSSPPAAAIPPADVVKYDGLSPEDAAKDISAPPGFSMKVFAGEPDVRQPIAFAMDHRARLWVAEAYTYPIRAKDGEGKDRILIFEDTDGDGKFDKRTVFIEKLNLVSGMEVGFGGVWVGAAPYLMFIPDRDGDDKPDGEPQILLDGFAYQDTHETLNTFTWGPDGWLYGCHGVFTQSNVGKPGSSGKDRTRINAGVFRYHPTRHQFELFSEGTSNPWGIDFDQYGQCHIEACVIPHFFHMIQGARYERQAGQHFNPYVYDDIKTIADHVHYAGNRGPHAGNSRSDAAGGGHAHAGLMVYQGTSWPAEYRNKVFMNNIHGQRLNMDIIERRGSGYVAKHGPDFINFNDRWSQVLNLLPDQDGSVFINDWYDKNQCHHNNAEGHDRANGRIFKIVYNHQKTTPVNLEKKSDAELVQLQAHENEWYVRHARRALQERGPNPQVHAALLKLIQGGNSHAALRALWALDATGGFTEANGLPLLQNPDEYVRAWVIQCLAESKNVSDAALKRFAEMAKKDPSPVVRLYLGSALLRVPAAKRWDVLSGLVAHAEDTADHNLPLVYWYAAEGSVGEDPVRGLGLLAEAKIPRLRQFISRRIASESKLTASN